MEKRPLGLSDIAIGRLVLGGNVFGWTADQDASFAIMDRFMDAGLNAIDTADVYSLWVPGHKGGESETVIGDWLSRRGRRDEVVIASKVGGAPPVVKGELNFVLSADHIVKSVEASLKRLRTDYIDLYQAHGDDPSTPLQESLEAFDRLVKAGKVRAIGSSHFTAERLAKAHDIGAAHGLSRPETMQPRYSLCTRNEFEGALQKLCLDRDIGVLAYGALAKGFLSGKFRSEADVAGKVYADFLRPYLGARGQRILQALDGVAGEQGATAASVAIAWVLAQPGVTAAIVAVDTPGQLEELLGGVEVTLTSAQIAALTEASDDGSAATRS